MTFHALDFTHREASGAVCGSPHPHITTTNPSWVTCPDCLKAMKEKSE